MVKKMLVDANHPEETRVVVINGEQLDGFDIETASRKQNKGNIYLAKVIRVEPSLQAAFVDYGGNRNGFLAFTEIHPDYFQIPIADKQALLLNNSEKEENEGNSLDVANNLDSPSELNNTSNFEDEKSQDVSVSKDILHNESKDISSEPVDLLSEDQENISNINSVNDKDPLIEEIGGEDESEDSSEAHKQKILASKKYKIQEVIKRRQILLVQVTKEERGNKGAALTTYLSLAGRYCVLMPNNSRGGGISRKITNLKDRRRLKSIISELEVSEQMGVILRTAGSERSKAEIKRDYDYLLRTWNQIRNRTMKSRAPEMIHEEANLIKRSIRDVYTKDIEEIQVEGEKGYKSAKDFMRLLTPSHAKKIKRYKFDNISLFQKYNIEKQLDEMHSPSVNLRSGGSIVFGQTEALVAIDVNSGKSTKERHIEETALKTNLEAAEEIARQLRLRDLAGLVVIDFIDMENFHNNQSVEKKLKESLKVDRAKIQVGRISHFGLLELSRQRLRPSLIETQFETCSNCNGTGVTRSIESTSIQILREIEQEILKNRSNEINISVSPNVALHILNFKRNVLEDFKKRLGSSVFIEGDSSLVPPQSRIINNTAKDSIKIKSEDEQTSDRSTSVRGDNFLNQENKNDKDQEKRKKRRRRRKKKLDNDEKIIESNEDSQIPNIDSSENKKSEELYPQDKASIITNNITEKSVDSEQNKSQKRREWRGKGKWRRRPRTEKTEKVEADESKENNLPKKNITVKNETEKEKSEIKKNISGIFAAIRNSVVENSLASEKNDENKSLENSNGRNDLKSKSEITAKRGWWNKKE